MKKNIILSLIFCGQIFLAQNKSITFSLNKNTTSKDITPAGNSIDDIEISSNNNIWVINNKTVSLSTDNGKTWKNFTQDRFKESVVAVDSYNNEVWITLGKKIDGTDTGLGLVYTNDDGKTWSFIPQPKDSSGDSTIVYGINRLRALPIVTNKQNISWDIAVTEKAVWIASWGGGLRKSTDKGKTWQRIVLPPDNMSSIKPTDTLSFSLQPRSGNFGPENYYNHMAFSVETIGNDTILVGTGGGFNISFDGGISWRRISSQDSENSISGNWVLDVTSNPFDKSIWISSRYSIFENEYNAVSASFDFGKTWETFLPNYKAWHIGFLKNEIIVPTESGLFVSSDNGETWINRSFITDSKNGLTLTASMFTYVKTNEKISPMEIWIGTNAGLVVNKTLSNFATGEKEILFKVGDAENKTKTFAFPNPFNPRKRLVNIKYYLSKPANSVTIRIFNFDMTLVKTLIQNVSRNNYEANVEYWDGTDNSGELLPNGVYFYRIDVDSDKPVFGKIVIIK